MYNGNEPLVQYSPADGKYTYYIYAGNQVIAEESNGSIEFQHKDHLGSTKVITDISGTKIAEYTYDPFGKVIAGSDGKQQYTGKNQDDTGLYYFGARFYDPEAGRFITPDTYTNLPNDNRVLFGGSSQFIVQGISNPQLQNRYSYCCNNPINLSDPDGHKIVGTTTVTNDGDGKYTYTTTWDSNISEEDIQNEKDPAKKEAKQKERNNDLAQLKQYHESYQTQVVTVFTKEGYSVVTNTDVYGDNSVTHEYWDASRTADFFDEMQDAIYNRNIININHSTLVQFQDGIKEWNKYNGMGAGFKKLSDFLDYIKKIKDIFSK